MTAAGDQESSTIICRVTTGDGRVLARLEGRGAVATVGAMVIAVFHASDQPVYAQLWNPARRRYEPLPFEMAPPGAGT